MIQGMVILGLIIGTLVFFGLGMAWYGPLFGKHWARLNGIVIPENPSDEEKKAMKKKMILLYGGNFFLSLVTVFAISLIAVSGLLDVVIVGFVGFVLPVIASRVIWMQKTVKEKLILFALDAGYYLVAYILTVVVVHFWTTLVLAKIAVS